MPLTYDTNVTWSYWTAGNTTAGTSTTTTAWNNWCQPSGTTVSANTITTDTTWGHWITQGTAANYVVTTVAPTAWEPKPPRELTPKEKAEAERAALIRRIRARSFEVRRRVANRAAKRLLLDHLREEQRREFEELDYFHVETADGQRRYRIRTGTHGNVRRVRGDGTEDRSYCIQPPGVPTYDAMLAQALMLETDEAEFLRVANERVLA